MNKDAFFKLQELNALLEANSWSLPELEAALIYRAAILEVRRLQEEAGLSQNNAAWRVFGTGAGGAMYRYSYPRKVTGLILDSLLEHRLRPSPALRRNVLGMGRRPARTARRGSK